MTIVGADRGSIRRVKHAYESACNYIVQGQEKRQFCVWYVIWDDHLPIGFRISDVDDREVSSGHHPVDEVSRFLDTEASWFLDTEASSY